MLKLILFFLSITAVNASTYYDIHTKKIPYIITASIVADCITDNEDFKNEVRAIKTFTSSKDNGVQVIEKMQSSKQAIVRHYAKYYSKVTAKTIRDEIYINTRMNPRPMPDMANTMIHERLHVLGYHHNGNSWKGNQQSVPYKVGLIAEKYSKVCYLK